MQEFLRAHIEKIVKLTDEEAAFVASHFNEETFGKNEFLITQGQRVNKCFFVVKGLLKLLFTDDSGKVHIVSFAMEDWWESDFNAFLNQAQAVMSLQCIETTEVLSITNDNFHKLCASLQKIEHFFLAKTLNGNIAAQQRIISFLTSDARQRYEQLLNRYPSLFQRVPKSMIASFLGVSRETLSRLSS